MNALQKTVALASAGAIPCYKGWAKCMWTCDRLTLVVQSWCKWSIRQLCWGAAWMLVIDKFLVRGTLLASSAGCFGSIMNYQLAQSALWEEVLRWSQATSDVHAMVLAVLTTCCVSFLVCLGRGVVFGEGRRTDLEKERRFWVGKGTFVDKWWVGLERLTILSRDLDYGGRTRVSQSTAEGRMTGFWNCDLWGLETVICEGWESENCWDVFKWESQIGCIYATPYSRSAMWCEWKGQHGLPIVYFFISVCGACCGDMYSKQSSVVNLFQIL